MAGVKISNLPAIVTPALSDVFPVVQSGTTYKESVTQLGSLVLLISGGTMTGDLILNGDPTSALQAATKQYVDAVATGLNIQGACTCASTTAFTVVYSNGTAGVGATLTNAGALAAFSADGVTPSVGERVLIKDQASALQNGIYTVTTAGSGAVAWVLTRATDFDTPAEIQPGDLVPVVNGTIQAGSSWMQTDTVTTVGTDSIQFIQFSASIPLNVPSGGTGFTTTTAYGLIAGGTTATGAFQNIGAGTVGQIIISNGASVLPSWSATAPAGLTIPQPIIQGITDGSSAAAGQVGQILSGTGTGVSLTTATPATIASVALTAGKWLVFGIIGFTPAGGTTTSNLVIAISDTTNTLPSSALAIGSSYAQIQTTFATSGYEQFSCYPTVININAGATYYLVGTANFAVSTMTADGLIYAVRIQ